MPQLLPNYSHHDGLYLKLRARGANGWNNESDDAYQEMFELISTDLPPATAEDGALDVLEIGCGAGNLSILLAQQGFRVSGVDISPAAIGWAGERTSALGQPIAFRVDDVLELSSCAPASFDLVVDGHCLHCIIGEDRGRCLASVWRVLRPGGVFEVLTMCGEVTNQRMLRDFDHGRKVTLHNGRPTRYIGLSDSIVAEITAAGFVPERVRVVARRDADDLDNLIIRARKTSPC